MRGSGSDAIGISEEAGAGMSEVIVAGERFRVRIEGGTKRGGGDVETVALAHQLGGSLGVWDAVAPALAERFRIVRFDCRGHGASVAPSGPYSLDGLARDAIGVLDALGVAQAHWIGLSMGAMIGQAAMLAAPARIGRAILANTAARLGAPEVWNERITAVRRLGAAGMAQATQQRWFTPEFAAAEPQAVAQVMAAFRATPAAGYAGACAALRDADLSEAVRRIRHRVLVIVGSRDPSAPPALGAYVASAIEGARLSSLATSHISPVEDADGFARAAIDFLTAP